jgi:pimeloyl-ACP methyl ester carboxylesterase
MKYPVTKTLSAILPFCFLCFTGCSPLVSHMAFFPDTKDTIPAASLPPDVKEVFIKTGDNVKVQCYLLPLPDSKNILLYFHGNGGNIGQRLPELAQLRKFGVSVLGVGYRGYGKSTGRPSEKGIYRDGAAAFKYAVDSLGYKAEKIFICGRSLGTTAAINLAVEKNIAGIILITPLSTGQQYARAHGLGFIAFLAGGAFDNLSKCNRLKCPALVIHGTIDEIAPFYMGEQLFNKLTVKKQFVKIEGGDHNGLEDKDPKAFWGSIKEFIRENTR